MIRSDKRMRLCLTLLLCNLAFIWGNSLLPGALSGALSDLVGSCLAVLLPEMPMEEGVESVLLRKLAHFTEFAALGALLSWLYGMLQKGKHYSLLCGIAAACIDETIQMFVPDRGPAIRDVLIDSCGVVTGMLLLYWGHARFQNKHLEEN